MPTRELYPDAPSPDALDAPGAGDRAVAGGMVRTAGYLAGFALTTVASLFLLRYLGVVGVGRYVTVLSLVAVVGGVTDAGLTVMGQREYVGTSGVEGRRRLLANLLGMRVVLTAIGGVLATVLAAAAGYDRVIVFGTAFAGAGLVLANAAATFSVPLATELRFGALTAVELARHVVTVGGIVLLAVLGAGLLPFFAVQILAGALALALAVAVLGRGNAVTPRFAGAEWRVLLRQTAPVALGLVLNVIYIRALILMISLAGDEVQTGLFATSHRIIEALVAIPIVMLGAAFPILSRAGIDDERRVAYALQRMAEASLVLAGGLVLVLAIAAEPIVAVLGGEEYATSAPVLRIHAFALLGAFMTQVWVLGLVATRRQSALVTVNLIALIVLVVLALALIPPLGASGAALAAATGETVLALTALVLLVRGRRALRPNAGFIGKVALAGGCGGLCALAPGIPALGAAALAGAVYAAVAWASGAVPAEVFQALARRRASA